MSYFLYIPGENMASFLTPQQIHSMTYQFSLDSIYKSQLLEPTFHSVYNSTSNLDQNIQPQVNENNEAYGVEEGQMMRSRGEKKKKEKNTEKQIESAKKNSESNLINHFFSYFGSRSKSESSVIAAIKFMTSDQEHIEKLIHLFYNTIHLINSRRGRKYVNKTIFRNIFNSEELGVAFPEIKDKIQKISGICLDQICQVFRRCSFFFYRAQSIDAVLTSRRISTIAKEEHLRKRRKVIKGILSEIEQK